MLKPLERNGTFDMQHSQKSAICCSQEFTHTLKGMKAVHSQNDRGSAALWTAQEVFFKPQDSVYSFDSVTYDRWEWVRCVAH